MGSYLALLVALADLREESHQLDADASRVAVVQDALLELLKSDPSLIHSVSHRHFEEIIFELMERLGFRAELTARTRDGGCDVIAFCSAPLGILLRSMSLRQDTTAQHKRSVLALCVS